MDIKVINIADQIEEQRQKREKQIEWLRGKYPWYSFKFNKDYNITKNLMPDLLAKHLRETIPSFSLDNDIYIYAEGIYAPSLNLSNMVGSKMIDGTIREAQLKEVENLWCRAVAIDRCEINARRDIVNFKNCLARITADGIKTYVQTPKYISTIQRSVSLLDKPSPTPIWDKFLSEILDSESIILLQEVMGYVISNDTLAKKLFILFGTTNTGKSVILEIIKSIIGAKYISSVPLQQICNPDNKFATYSLWGKVANTCGDIPQASLGDTGVLKQCTGEDMMQFERKHGDPFSDYCTARLIFSCNSMPASYNDRTSSFYNRLQIIKFNKTIPKCDQDKFLSSKLKTELNAIAYWAIQGYIRLLQNNYIFSTSKQSIEAIDKYECDNNPALGFFKEHLEFGTDFEMHSLKAYKQYEIWQNQNGQRPISLNKFVDELRTYALRNDAKIEKCRPYINGKRGMGFSGVHCNSVECDETSIF